MKTKPSKRDGRIRAALETINAELAVRMNMLSLTRLRVQQAKDRGGLNGLLSPALEELDEYAKSMEVVSSQVSAALSELLK